MKKLWKFLKDVTSIAMILTYKKNSKIILLIFFYWFSALDNGKSHIRNS